MAYTEDHDEATTLAALLDPTKRVGVVCPRPFATARTILACDDETGAVIKLFLAGHPDIRPVHPEGRAAAAPVTYATELVLAQIEARYVEAATWSAITRTTTGGANAVALCKKAAAAAGVRLTAT